MTNANDGSRLSLCLYYKCIVVALISKEHDDRLQEREISREYAFDDIQWLYSFFDVALEKNLASLVCHCILLRLFVILVSYIIFHIFTR